MTKQKKPRGTGGTGFQVGPGMWVRVRYAARDADGELVEDFEPELGYVHGYGALLESLEAALDGHRSGERLVATLPPEEAFGKRNEEAVIEVAREEFPEDVQAGDRFDVESDDGKVLVLRILDVHPDAVIADTNHPLAGQAVTFHLELLEVRPATAEELARAEAALEDPEPADGPLIPAARLLRGGSKRYEQDPRESGEPSAPESANEHEE
jgi:FKBP-type peptidyl-prolyl cis-trans isomerase SlyD